MMKLMVTEAGLERAQGMVEEFEARAVAAERDAEGRTGERADEDRMRAWAYRQCALAVQTTVSTLTR